MTSKELLQHQFDDAAYQLEKVFDGIDDSLDFKLTEQSMSPRETVVHLSECYVATVKDVNGEQHSWGTFQSSATDWASTWAEFNDLRAKATAAVLASDGAETKGHAYIVAHDFYHVGQLCQVRLVRDPGWDAYSIYNHG